jgi:hypothetical protein
MCRIVTCDCASQKMKYVVYTTLPEFSQPSPHLPQDLANSFEKVTLLHCFKLCPIIMLSSIPVGT